MTQQSLLYLGRNDIVALGGESIAPYVEGVRDALRLHAETSFRQPLKAYLKRDEVRDHVADRIIAMPAWLGGEFPVSGIKWIGSKHDNPERHGLPRASAVIVLNDPETNYPFAILEGALISAMRTAAVTVVAAEHLAVANFSTVACIGCGPIGETQVAGLVEHFSSIRKVLLCDRRLEAGENLAMRLAERFPDVSFVYDADVSRAVGEADLVATATVAEAPYLEDSWLRPGVFVANVSLMDCTKEVYVEADKVVVDDWDQSNRAKKIIHQLVEEGRFSREKLHAELGEIVVGRRPGRETAEERIILNPMGMAIEDLACARHFYRLAQERGLGTSLPLC